MFTLAIPPLGIHLTEFVSTQYLHMDDHIINNSLKWKQPKCPSTDELVNKIWYMHTWKLLHHLKK
jgi:hypothetical protein